MRKTLFTGHIFEVGAVPLKVGQTLTTEHSPTAVTFVSTFGQGEKEDVVFGVFVLFFPVLLPVFDDMLAKTLAFGLTLATLPPQGLAFRPGARFDNA